MTVHNSGILIRNILTISCKYASNSIDSKIGLDHLEGSSWQEINASTLKSNCNLSLLKSIHQYSQGIINLNPILREHSSSYIYCFLWIFLCPNSNTKIKKKLKAFQTKCFLLEINKGSLKIKINTIVLDLNVSIYVQITFQLILMFLSYRSN